MKDRKLSTQMGWGYGPLILITVALGAMAIWNMKSVQVESDMLSKHKAPILELANTMQAISDPMMESLEAYYASGDKEDFFSCSSTLAQSETLLSQIEEEVSTSNELHFFEEDISSIKEAISAFSASLEKSSQVILKLNHARESFYEKTPAFIKACKNLLTEETAFIQKESNVGNMSSKVKSSIQKIDLLNQIIENIYVAQILLKNEIDSDSLSEGQKITENLNVLIRDLQNISIDKSRFSALSGHTVAFENSISEFMELAKEASSLKASQLKYGNTIYSTTSSIVRKTIQEVSSVATKASRQLFQFSNIMIFGLTLSVIIGISTAIFTTRTITRGIQKVIHGLSESSKQVASAAGELSSNSQELSDGASQQAASIEETSSSLEEVSSMTKQNADGAMAADELMHKTSLVVEEASASMKSLTQSMEDMASSGKETQKIIKTIDEIAFQTNLLALNAAVEAARAGEAGAGFAVVADEVRNLAMRAAEAAKNTAELIEESVQKINHGASLVEVANSSFIEVETSAKEAAHLVDSISTASQEQSRGIEQINRTIAEMDRIIQDNAANAETTASAAEQLNAQSEQLQGYVAQLLRIVEDKKKKNKGKDSSNPDDQTPDQKANFFTKGNFFGKKNLPDGDFTYKEDA